MNEPKCEKSGCQIWEYLALLGIILTGVVVRYHLVTYNLPVASNIDERAMLRVLYRLDHENTLNPDFFSYPTLYLYLNYFVLRPFVDLKEFLYFGKIINLALAGLLAIGTFCLSKQVYKIAMPSLLAAAFTMFSPTIIYSSSYIITDIQLALFCILSILFLDKFFETNAYRSWLLGVSFMGLALATKYSAIALIGAYFIVELIHSNFTIDRINSKKLDSSFVKLLNTRIAAKYISLLLLGVCLSFICFYFFFPYEVFWSVLQEAGNLDSVISQNDRLFVEALRSKLLTLGILSGALAIISFFFRNFTERFGLLRPYVGMLIAGALLVMTSPFILISWKKFIYDFGSVMKHSQEGGLPQWISYIKSFSAEESLLIFVFLLVGLWHSWQRNHRTLLLIVYLIVSYVVFGSASEGFLRYLTPVLPVVFVVSAWGIYATGTWLVKKFDKRFLQNFLVLAVAVAITVELSQKVYAQIFLPRDDMYASYAYVMQQKPSKVYYSAHAPDVELRLAGFEVEQLPLRSLTQNNTDLLNRMKPTEILIVDGTAITTMNPQLKQQLSLVWQAIHVAEDGKFNFNNQLIFTKRSY